MKSFSFATALPPRCVLACALAAVLFPTHAIAADDEADAKTLSRVVVIGAPVQPLKFETDTKLPRQPVPASDGADYLKTIPGFTALRNGGSNGDPVLRGMFGSRLNMLTNDGAMPGACPSRMDNAMSYVAPETFDRLVVVKGPQTVQWGPGASAGTVRFERDTPRFDAPGWRAQASLLGGSFGRNDQMIDATAGATQGYVRVAANRSEASDYDDGTGVRVPSAWKKWNADVALGWTPDADTLLELSLGAGDGQARYGGRSMDGSKFERSSTTLRFERSFAGVLSKLQASAYRNSADHVMDNYTLRDPNPASSMPMAMASNVYRVTEGGRVASIWAWNAFELTAGVDTQESRHRKRSASGRDVYLTKAWMRDATLRNTGVFAEGTWSPASAQRVVAGARMDAAKVTDHRAMLGMTVNPTAGQTRSEHLPAGFIRYERDVSSSGLGWYAGLGHVARMPDYWELFSANSGPMGSANAFAGVRPEKTTQLDAGVQWRGEQSSAWVSGYVGNISDYILFRYMSGGMMGSTSMASNVDARIHGAEAGGEWRPAKNWALEGSVAWAWGSNEDAHAPLPQMTPLEGRVSLAYDNGRWSGGALLRMVAAQTRVALSQGNVTGRDLGPSAGFATVALSTGYRVSERVQLTAGVDNVFNRNYSEHLNLAGNADFGYPAMPVRIHEPGRNLWLKLNFTL
ncbi:MAG: TonB-dependent copper receptor [Thermomonas sp.]|uniref:TonB-dependent copper receptor n=1 Tax=Thermomonas sp. TaxID=1971895 RepID=UPI001ECDCEF2|nr:TonB-dependent copper receptor [Thermomonas sp.]MBV2208830.1 TonB-dependent copper receptor [Thermomonas sp.]